MATQRNPDLAGDGFQLLYQPIVSLKGDSQENYSLFPCVRDDRGNPIEAGELLSATVRSEDPTEIDHWVVDQAIEELARQRALERRVNFFVNISEKTLLEDELLIWVCDQLRRRKARGNWLTVQVSQEHARRHPGALAKLDEGLRRVECRVALNRCGPDPDTQALLEVVRADFAVFAPEVTAGAAVDDAKRKRLLQLAAAARKAGTRTVATGAEDARALTMLWTVGVDYVQGDFLHKPAPVIEHG